MCYESLGHMKNAPLVYTVGMIEYGHIPAIAKFSPAIQEELRREFPEILPRFTINTVQIKLDAIEGKQEFSQVQALNWAMNTANRKWGIVFGENRLILQTSGYEHFADFTSRFRMVIEVLVEKAGITHTNKIGIRYIDNIQEIGDLEVSSLIGEGFLSHELTSDFKPEISRVEHVYRSQEGHLFIRCYGLSNHQGIPEDVRVMADQLFRGQGPMVPISNQFTLLDTDHIYTPEQLEELDIDQVISRLERLHEGASMAFRTVVTKEAINAWKGEIDAN